MKKIIPPGSTIGMLGGGQLGRMFAFAAKRLGYRVITLDPTPNSPMGQVCDEQIVGELDDMDSVLELGGKSDVITYEFEHIGFDCVEALEAKGKIVRPSSHVLKITQHRLLEKECVIHAGVNVADYEKVENAAEFDTAVSKIGFPAVIKTVHGGYDGKGQAIVKDRATALKAFNSFKGKTLVWERKIPFVKELSVMCVRDLEGNVVSYPVTENIHINNILDITIAPARVSKKVEKDAKAIAENIAVQLDIVGTFCVEMFLLANNNILVNEIAPRPHNSGHYTIEACVTSQFEQQLRAITGLPLGSTELRSPAVMVNLLGDGKGNKLSGVDKILADPRIHFHLYGKQEAKARRKMGHFTVLDKNVEEALTTAYNARKKLKWVE